MLLDGFRGCRPIPTIGAFYFMLLDGFRGRRPIPTIGAFHREIDCGDGHAVNIKGFSSNISLRLEVIATIRAIEHGSVFLMFFFLSFLRVELCS